MKKIGGAYEWKPVHSVNRELVEKNALVLYEALRDVMRCPYLIEDMNAKEANNFRQGAADFAVALLDRLNRED